MMTTTSRLISERAAPITLWLGVLLSSGCALSPAHESAPYDWRQADAGTGPEAAYYYLMVGELAGQREAYADAAEAYQKAAELSADPQLAQRSLTVAEFAKRDDAALAAARLWVSLVPDSADAQRKAAAWELKHGDQEVAVGHLRQSLSLTDGGFDNLRGLVNVLQNAVGPGQTVDALLPLVPEYADSVQSWILLGELALVSNRPDVAFSAAERVATLDDGSTDDALILRSRAMVASGDTERAMAEVEQALQARPGNNALRLSYARMLLSMQRNDAARQQYQRILKNDSNMPEALYAMALLAMEEEDSVTASDYFQRARKTGRFVDESSFYLGTIAEDRKQYQDALANYSRVRNGDLAVTSQQRIAWVMAKLDRVDAARQHLANVRERNVAVAPRMWATEGEILFDQGRYEASRDVLSEALKQYPENTNLLYARALSEEKLGNIDRVEADLRRFLEIAPNDPVALNALGYTLADATDRYDEAIGYIEQALAQQPDDPATLDSMGWVLFKQGDPEAALVYLQRAFAAMPDPEIGAHLGEVLWVSGQQDQAREVWQRAVAADPDSPRATIVQQTRQRLGAE